VGSTSPAHDVGLRFQCPIPISEYPIITMAHGGGGRLTQMLIERMFIPAFANPSLETLHDGAILALPPPFPVETAEEGRVGATRLAFTTDSFVITPRFFPGGDIGSLSVHGTVNDLAMCGARPLALSAGFILEEGLAMEELWRIVRSIQAAAQAANVPVVTGDTKVVDRGRGDGIYINTTGVGIVPPAVEISPRRARPGDMILINGPIAMHGIAVMSAREGLEFETALQSDAAPLHNLVAHILEAAAPAEVPDGHDRRSPIHVLRDPTRGGVASALNEIAAQARVGIRLWEANIPIGDAVRGACEILGLDPLYVANEGKCLAIVAAEAAEAVLAAMRADPLGKEAAIIGEIVKEQPGRVTMRSRVGGWRIVDVLTGEQLPRIC
jgi:hydrogenase expression/formation protein HypE